jgi:hypothetical protein
MRNYRLALIIFLVPLVMTCIEPYETAVKNKNPNYLVIDGFLNSATGSGRFVLTRTTSLKDNNPPNAEWFAQMTIESENGERFNAINYDMGIHEFSGIPLQIDSKYRMRILTANGKEYVSDFVPVLNSPPIDSITWGVENNQLNVFVNSHDDTGKSRYYRWFYNETWEYTTLYTSGLKIVDGIVYNRNPDELINRCWQSENSTDIMVGSTSLLDNDIVSKFKLLSISKGSIKTSTKYSVLVTQQVLSEAGYTYWNNIKKTTESLGGLFDPLPSQVTGNFHCLSNPSEPVIGFFEAGNFTEKRIFVKFSNLPSNFAFHQPFCRIDTVLVEDVGNPRNPDSLIGTITPPGQLEIIGYSTAESVCLDCRVLGNGYTYRPPFWE